MDKASIEELIKAQNQPFKCASFSGGGAKGAIYSGAHEAMTKSGIIDGLEAVAGSSAGAITATMIATGITNEKFKKISGETNLKGLLGEGGIVNKDGKPLLELMRTTIRSNITDYLEGKDVVGICNQRLEAITKQKVEAGTLPENERQEMLTELNKQEALLRSFIGSGGKEINDIKQKALDPQGMITFRDISLLRVIAPETFKDLVITATRRDTGDLEIFDSRNSPDVEIALACRASASIPIVFEPVTINGKQYVDGGYRDNIPLSHFNKDKKNEATDITGSNEEVKLSKDSGRTLALAFGSGMKAEANVAIYSAKEKIVDPGRLVKFLMDVVFKAAAKVGGIFKYSEEENKVHEKLRENALNTVVLDTKEVSTLSFDLAQERSEYLHIKGYMQTARHFDNHDIAPIKDPNFELKDFMLKVYEDTQKKGTLEGWKDKVVGAKDNNLKEILEYCKDDAWKNKNPQEVVSDFVQTCSKNGPSKLMSNTKSMKALVNGLNDAFTPEVVREAFIKELGIDLAKDKRFDQNKDFSQNLAKFKFTEGDFKGFIQEKQMAKSKSEPKSMTEKYSKEKPSPKGELLKSNKKDILSKGKSSSISEKIATEKANMDAEKKR